MRLAFAGDVLHALMPFGALELAPGASPKLVLLPGYPKLEAASPDAAEEPFAMLADGTDVVDALDEVLEQFDDVATFPDGTLAVVRTETSGKGGSKKVVARLELGPLPAEGEGFARTLELTVPARVAKVAWPKGLALGEGKAPAAGTGKALAHAGAPMRVGASADGVAVAQHLTGLVVVLRPGTAAASFALRLPGGEGLRLLATPTPQGALVAVCAEFGASALLHVSEDGSVLGALAAEGLCPPRRLGSRHVLIAEGEARRLRLCSLPRLEVVSEREVDCGPVDLATSDDGAHFAVADTRSLVVGELDGTQLEVQRVVDVAALLADKRTGGRRSERPASAPPRARAPRRPKAATRARAPRPRRTARRRGARRAPRPTTSARCWARRSARAGEARVRSKTRSWRITARSTARGSMTARSAPAGSRRARSTARGSMTARSAPAGSRRARSRRARPAARGSTVARAGPRRRRAAGRPGAPRPGVGRAGALGRGPGRRRGAPRARGPAACPAGSRRCSAASAPRRAPASGSSRRRRPAPPPWPSPPTALPCPAGNSGRGASRWTSRSGRRAAPGGACASSCPGRR
jgi:hypothetical protein